MKNSNITKISHSLTRSFCQFPLYSFPAWPKTTFCYQLYELELQIFFLPHHVETSHLIKRLTEYASSAATHAPVCQPLLEDDDTRLSETEFITASVWHVSSARQQNYNFVSTLRFIIKHITIFIMPIIALLKIVCLYCLDCIVVSCSYSLVLTQLWWVTTSEDYLFDIKAIDRYQWNIINKLHTLKFVLYALISLNRRDSKK